MFIVTVSIYDTFRLIPFYNNKSNIKSEVSHTARHLDRPYFSSERPKLNHWFVVPYLKLIPRHVYKGIFPRFCEYIIGSIIHYWRLTILKINTQFMRTACPHKFQKFATFTHSKNKINPKTCSFDFWDSFIQPTCMETTCKTITKYCVYKDEQ